MIEEIVFKGVKGIKLFNKCISVVVLPSIGGKIASYYHKAKDFELLFQNKQGYYQQAELGEDFALFDCSGFDDCFPTIDSCNIKYENKQIEYPDHGEIWTADFDYKVEKESVGLLYCSQLLPYVYRKKVSIKDNELHLGYKITNQGKGIIPCLWAMHCLINCSEEMRLHFPTQTDKVENVLESNYLGEIGKIHSFPLTVDNYGNEYRLDRVLSSANKYEKYYVCGEVSEGSCGVYYSLEDVRFSINYNKELLPYLGFWVSEGGFKGDYNCAFEPSNGYYDSVVTALENGKVYQLKPGKSLEFMLELSLS
ncbi:DUF5107 domain-containing protein [Halocella sp. SP3-1]|uniref:DUF5107 domain-containing protein n=1 Tax=Halocella sp. SP3-1 TaxID=2382161 RepID=UPI000F74D6C8|nr:DUF5107 domain-containing protein [Halocella sp. SP3-1]AZO93346.1 DUF5107 domain-containing protein [Halocella sp. SP3-1]